MSNFLALIELEIVSWEFLAEMLVEMNVIIQVGLCPQSWRKGWKVLEAKGGESFKEGMII